MPVIGNPRSFHKKFRFIVEIDDVGHAGFQRCSELSVAPRTLRNPGLHRVRVLADIDGTSLNPTA